MDVVDWASFFNLGWRREGRGRKEGEGCREIVEEVVLHGMCIQVCTYFSPDLPFSDEFVLHPQVILNVTKLCIISVFRITKHTSIFNDHSLY